MPRQDKREGGFHSAAGLIRYFDSEDEKSIKVPPWAVVVLCIATALAVYLATYFWPLSST